MALPPTVQQTIDEALAAMQQEIGRALVAKATDAFLAGEVAAWKDLRLPVRWDLVDSAALAYLKTYAKDVARGGSTIDGRFVPWLEDSTQATRDRLVTAIEETIQSGKGVDKLANAIGDLFTERRNHAETVARTEMSRIRNDAAVGRYVKAGVKTVEVTGPDDGLTCEDCSLIVGERYPIDRAPYVPVHPRCRHGLAGVVEVGE